MKGSELEKVQMNLKPSKWPKESIATSNRRRTSSQRKDGWSEFSVENLRSPMSRQISRRSKGVTTSIPKGSKLRRSRTIDPSHKGHWIYAWNSILGFRGWKSRKLCNGNHEIMKHDIPKAKRICVGHGGVSEWTGGTLLTRSQTLLTILEFRGE
jgi:hypothetical protein